MGERFSVQKCKLKHKSIALCIWAFFNRNCTKRGRGLLIRQKHRLLNLLYFRCFSFAKRKRFCTFVPKLRNSVKIKQVLSALEQFAPLPLQESWDNAGLQIGLTEAEVSGALLCLDVTEKIIDEAIAKGCNLVVSHHPLLFRGLKQVSDANDVQRTVRKAIKADICVISMHTNMDNAKGGVNFKIAERLGAKCHTEGKGHTEITESTEIKGRTEKEGHTEITEPTADGQRESQSTEIKGHTDITDSTEMGTPIEPIDPISPTEKIPMVLAELPQPLQAQEFVELVKERFGVKCAHCNELLQRPIRKVAICGGAGDFMLDEAIAKGADAFITGEMHYHQYFGHEQQIQICVIGHYESEQFTAEIFQDIIHQACPGLRTEIAATNTNPIIYV